MIQFFSSLYFSNRFYLIWASIVGLFVLGYMIPIVYAITWMLCLCFAVSIIIDFILLFFTRKPVFAKRTFAERFSNGDSNLVSITVENLLAFPLKIKLIDEIPVQFQFRNFLISLELNKNDQKIVNYSLRPTERGLYTFGFLNVYISSYLSLVERRLKFERDQSTKVYPSFVQMKKYELIAISDRLTEIGIKKIRKVSRNNEFDQIRDYVQGDDMRIINWKATARKNTLMVNQYHDEKSQQVFCLIDKGRTMKMPFKGMSLLDYSINASLVLSNIALLKQDKAGLLTYSTNVDQFVVADRGKKQLNNILDALYGQQTNFFESNNELLYITIRQKIKQRSLLFLFTNFEGLSSLMRQLPFFNQLSKNHLLVIIFFENTEISATIEKKSKTVEDIYIKTISEKFSREKRQIVKELHKYGIHSILTSPEKLTVDSINKYLQLKALGLI